MKFLLLLLALLVFISGCVAPAGTSISKNESTALSECAASSDCAAGGCSGQVCTTSGKATSLVTTCEWRAEYECYRKTSCGCVEGSCSWVETPEFTECFESFI